LIAVRGFQGARQRCFSALAGTMQKYNGRIGQRD
jgi:hypothetical protein